jgi:hypothetical protein
MDPAAGAPLTRNAADQEVPPSAAASPEAQRPARTRKSTRAVVSQPPERRDREFVPGLSETPD